MGLPKPIPFSMFDTPRRAGGKKLLIIGEAPGENEVKERTPFVGESGKLLNELLGIVGLPRENWHVTNVFSERPPDNDLKGAWTVTKTELKKLGYSDQGRLPQLNKRYLLPEREPEVERLKFEIERIKPDFILALGGTALWALTGDGRISLHRGTIFNSIWAPAIASFHPAMILRQWDQRPLLWADLLKASRYLHGTLPAPLHRRLYINPTPAELEYVYGEFRSNPSALLGVDIETAPGCDQITTIAFGTPTLGICIPVWDRYMYPVPHCYADVSSELATWDWICKYAALPNPKVMQNGLYDLQYLLDTMDIRVTNLLHDSAILQHALQPELPKALGTLASLYLNEPSWKFMRESAKDDNKADE